MKKQVWKFELEVKDGVQLINMPEEAQILRVESQIGIPCIWALVNPKNKTEDRCFEVFGTGHDIYHDMGIERNHIGTVGIPLSWEYVFHVFERIN